MLSSRRWNDPLLIAGISMTEIASSRCEWPEPMLIKPHTAASLTPNAVFSVRDVGSGIGSVVTFLFSPHPLHLNVYSDQKPTLRSACSSKKPPCGLAQRWLLKSYMAFIKWTTETTLLAEMFVHCDEISFEPLAKHRSGRHSSTPRPSQYSAATCSGRVSSGRVTALICRSSFAASSLFLLVKAARAFSL